MKIAATGNPASRKTIQSLKLNPALEWVWVDSVGEMTQHRDVILYADLDFRFDKDRIRELAGLLPLPVLVHSVVYTLTDIGYPFIRINGWPGMLERNPVELAIGEQADRASIQKLFENMGWACRIVPDIPGLIAGRILASIINEAYYTLQDRVSTQAEIDEAMVLGTGYPEGPFAWAARIGIEHIHALLATLRQTDPRYRPAQTLEAELGSVKI